MKKIVNLLLIILFMQNATAFARPYHCISAAKNYSIQKQGNNDSTLILIPFDYKQSALYHQFTFEVIDSVVNLLQKNNTITISIDGYAHQDEGSDTILKYLSLNRALFVRDYMLGRGIKEDRIIAVQGLSAAKSVNSNVNKDGHALNCRAELRLNYPPPPKPIAIADRDGDGIPDSEDACADEYGYKENNGCPDKDAIVIPFQFQESTLSSNTYKALDSVVMVLKENPSFTVVVQGHSHAAEGANAMCERLAMERATIVKNYLVSRNVRASRIFSVESFGNRRPFNAGRNTEEVTLNSRAQILLKK